MEANPTRDRDRELWGVLRQAAHAMDRAREDELRRIGLSMMQAEVLYIVKVTKGPVTPAHISRCIFREPHSVSGLLQRMEKQGLVKRVQDLERKNLVRVALTEKGEEVCRQSNGLEPIRKIMSHLSPEERDSLRADLETLRDKALEQHQRRPRWSFA